MGGEGEEFIRLFEGTLGEVTLGVWTSLRWVRFSTQCTLSSSYVSIEYTPSYIHSLVPVCCLHTILAVSSVRTVAIKECSLSSSSPLFMINLILIIGILEKMKILDFEKFWILEFFY